MGTAVAVSGATPASQKHVLAYTCHWHSNSARADPRATPASQILNMAQARLQVTGLCLTRPPAACWNSDWYGAGRCGGTWLRQPPPCCGRGPAGYQSTSKADAFAPTRTAGEAMCWDFVQKTFLRIWAGWCGGTWLRQPPLRFQPEPPVTRERRTDAGALHTHSVREFKKLAGCVSEKSWRFGAEVLGCDNRLCVAAEVARVREDRYHAGLGAPTSSRSLQKRARPGWKGPVHQLGARRCGGTWLRQPPSRCGRVDAPLSWELALWREN